MISCLKVAYSVAIVAVILRRNCDLNNPLNQYMPIPNKRLCRRHAISTSLFDGMYYELTYNGDKKEWYLDAYKKFQNVVIPD